MAEVPNIETGRTFLNRLEAAMGPVHTLHPVDGGGAQGAEVWHAVLSSGEHVAVKRHAHAGAGEVEFGVLHMLYQLGTPVPRPLQWVPQQRVLITEWVGQRTLAEAIHEAHQDPTRHTEELRRLAKSLLKGCNSLETAFQGMADRLALHATGERQRRHAEARARCRQAPETLLRLAAYCGLSAPQDWATDLHEAWTGMAESLCAGRLTFGGRDCTPNNVLSADAALWFVDFAVIGLDWPEARLAQYAAVVAARAPETPLQSLLTHGEEQWYVGSGCIDCEQLDMHHLLLWSEVLRLLLDGKLGTHESNSIVLRQRLEQALQLALFPLAANTPAEPVRSLIATAFTHVT